MDLALNNLQRLICHKIQPTNSLTARKIQIQKTQKEENGCTNRRVTHKHYLMVTHATRNFLYMFLGDA